MIQWLRLCASKAEGMGSIPDQGAKIPHAALHSLKKERERNLYYVFIRLTCQKDAAATAKSLQSCPTLCDPIDGSPPGSPPSLGLSRQEHWSGLPFPSPMHESEK